ncbi:uncharacterized protein [Gossypium hirsutum]|uniref:Uncharacterized protein isoform X4 n=2 Tax=Gossypium TaxID=3633 RepID=A0A1U8M0K1_GOSHI|nr:uncharacterized protein LOC107932742 isoform X4 [Gossypium hirsutum]
MAMPLQAYSAGPHKQMFDLMECPITGVFHSKLKQRYFLISILFPLFRLPIRCLKNPILPSPNSHLENTQMVAISCFLRLWHSSPSSKARKTPSLESIDSFGEEEGCPHLEKWCNEGGGEGWPYIARVPYIKSRLMIKHGLVIGHLT